MFAYLRLPPGKVLLAANAEDAAELVKIVGRLAVVHETATAFERLEGGAGNPEQYFNIGRDDDPRMVALRKAGREEAMAEIARAQARLESWLSGAPVGIKDERPLAAVLPHKPREE